MSYLDNAATTWPKPQGVARAMTRAVEEFGGNPGRGGHALSVAAAREVYACRAAAGALLGAPPERVIFTMNATHALNMALAGTLNPGDGLIISDVEHNAVVRPAHALEKRGVTVRAAVTSAQDDGVVLRAMERLIDSHTRAVAVTACSNVTGCRLPVRGIGEIARRYGLIFILDASQTAGIQPCSMEQDNIDILCAPGHKGLYGPQGSGLMVLGAGAPQPLFFGGTGGDSASPDMPPDPPERYEAGTPATPAIAGLRAGIESLAGRQGAIAAAEESLAACLYDGLRRLPGVSLYTPRPGPGMSGPVPFNIADLHSERAAALLDADGIMTRGGQHCAPFAHRKLGTAARGAVRVSFGRYNDIRDVELLLASVKKILKEV